MQSGELEEVSLPAGTLTTTVTSLCMDGHVPFVGVTMTTKPSQIAGKASFTCHHCCLEPWLVSSTAMAHMAHVYTSNMPLLLGQWYDSCVAFA